MRGKCVLPEAPDYSSVKTFSKLCCEDLIKLEKCFETKIKVNSTKNILSTAILKKAIFRLNLVFLLENGYNN